MNPETFATVVVLEAIAILSRYNPKEADRLLARIEKGPPATVAEYVAETRAAIR